MDYYPRVNYHSAILCLAKWRLSHKDFEFLRSGNSDAWLVDFNRLCNKIRLPKFFALTQNDNHLVFDQEDDEDILLFLDTIKSNDTIVLSEYLMDENESSLECEKLSKPLVCQYIASLFLDETVYGTAGVAGPEDGGTGHRMFMPGTEWLYFKIYCHPAWSGDLLCNILFPLLKTAGKKSLIDKWFYVRYNDPDYHIRLRVHVVNNAVGDIITLFSNKLKGLLDESMIDRYYVDTYVREMERYSPALIEDVETFFYHSSVLLVSYFCYSTKYGLENSYNLDVIVLSVDLILDAFNLSIDEKAHHLQNLFASFFKEFGEGKNLKKSLDKKYSECRNQVNEIYECRQLQKSQQLKPLFNNIKQAARNIASRYLRKSQLSMEQLLGDLLHMHLNRAFVENPRKQEMIVYYLLFKHYTALMYKRSLRTG